MKGFSERNLQRMKFIYEEIEKNQISPQTVAKLHWGHTSLLVYSSHIHSHAEARGARKKILYTKASASTSSITVTGIMFIAFLTSSGISSKSRS